jgi:hypothetical protein
MHRPLPSPHFICARCDTRAADGQKMLRNCISTRRSRQWPAAQQCECPAGCISPASAFQLAPRLLGTFSFSLSHLLVLSPLRTSCESETALSGKRHTAVSLRQKVGPPTHTYTKTRLLFNKILQHRGSGQREKSSIDFLALAKNSAVFTAPCGFDGERILSTYKVEDSSLSEAERCSANKMQVVD